MKPNPACEKPCMLIQTDFETHPIAQGWFGVGLPPIPFDGEWHTGTAHSGQRALFAQFGGWDSPAFPIQPFRLYRISFWSKSASQALWVTRFFEDGGRESIADHYSAIDPGEGWRENEFFFVGRANSAWARLGFRVDQCPFFIDDVTVQESDRETLLRWHDALYAAIPPVVYTPEPGRFMLLQNTMRKLRSGPALRMVMLGDSIINDIANSLFHVLLERRYPRTQVQLVHSVGGGKGCWYFKAENRLQAAVFGHRPDMVVIGGASHGNDLESIREVIREVRRATQADVLLTTDAFLEFGWTQQYRQQGFIPAAAKAKALEDNRRFRQQLRQLADEEQAAFLDVREHWNRYVDASPKPLKWYQRDYVHANARGQEVVARILDGFFSDR